MLYYWILFILLNTGRWKSWPSGQFHLWNINYFEPSLTPHCTAIVLTFYFSPGLLQFSSTQMSITLLKPPCSTTPSPLTSYNRSTGSWHRLPSGVQNPPGNMQGHKLTCPSISPYVAIPSYTQSVSFLQPTDSPLRTSLYVSIGSSAATWRWNCL